MRAKIEAAECLIKLGVRFIDSTTGSFTEHIDPERCIQVNSWHGRAHNDDFQGICMADVLDRLIAQVEAMSAQAQAATPAKPAKIEVQSFSQLTQGWFWHRMASFVKAGDVIAAENDTSLSGVAGMPLASEASVISHALWGAIGYHSHQADWEHNSRSDRRCPSVRRLRETSWYQGLLSTCG